MARTMHLDAQEAAAWIKKYRIIPNIDPRGKTSKEIIGIAEQLQDVYRVKVVEVLNRCSDKTAITIMRVLRKQLGILPLLGTGIKWKHVEEAIENGAVGYVSPGKNSKAIHMAIAHFRDGARLAIPTVMTPGEYYDVVDDKTDAYGVEYASELPSELWWNKVFPGTLENLIQPDEEKGNEANAFLRRMLGPGAERELNFYMLVTGHDRAEQALPYLQIQRVGKQPIITATGPALDDPRSAYPWFEAVAVSQQDSPWNTEGILKEARRKLGKVARLNYLQKRLPREEAERLQKVPRRRPQHA